MRCESQTRLLLGRSMSTCPLFGSWNSRTEVTLPTNTVADSASSSEGGARRPHHEHAWLTPVLAKSHKPLRERTKATCMARMGIRRTVPRFLSILIIRLSPDRTRATMWTITSDLVTGKDVRPRLKGSRSFVRGFAQKRLTSTSSPAYRPALSAGTRIVPSARTSE